MSWETWLAFTLAASIVLAIPGPTVLLVIGYSLSHGRRIAASTVAGVALGDLVAMTVSLAGLGALLATSATLFTILKWIGAAYLVYLGIRLWRTPVPETPDAADAPVDGSTGRRAFRQAFVVTMLNPKSIAFFVAFVPQFVNPHTASLLDLAILEATFVALAAFNAALYALLAGQARRLLTAPVWRRRLNRTGGTALIGAGGATAALSTS